MIPVEDTAAANGTVSVFAHTPPGRWVRRAGEDIIAGASVLSPGTPLGPAELGVLASLGHGSAVCTRRPRLSVLTTGDELLPPEPRSHRERCATRVHTRSRRSRVWPARRWCRWRALRQERAIEQAIADALGSDVVIVCGGVSVGKHDHVKDAFAALDVREHFSAIALRPGKPTWFGVRGQTLVFGLPGNPVSSMVTFILLVGPALRALSGAPMRTLATTATLPATTRRLAGARTRCAAACVWASPAGRSNPRDPRAHMC